MSTRLEPGCVVAVWALLAVVSLLAFPVSPVPRQWGSWDSVHSGRRFAELGFLANKLQPVWAPVDHRAAYLAYTHYPPLPQWGAGVAEMLSSSPQGRIVAVHHMIRLLGITGLALIYVLLRHLACAPAAAALAVALTAASSRMWVEITTQASWYGWCVPLLLGSTACFIYALRSEAKHWKIGLATGVVLSLGTAMCAYQAWSWYPAFFGVLLLSAGARHSEQRTLRKRLLVGLLLSGSAVGLAIAIRVAINWWYFGSLETTVGDFMEAYQTRSTGSAQGVQIEENRANYYVQAFEGEKSRIDLLWQFCRHFAPGMLDACLPGGSSGRWIALTTFALGGAGWLLGRRAPGRETRRAPAASSPGPLAIWLALLAAPLLFILLCPAIAATQWLGESFWMFPAWIVLLGFSLHFALGLVSDLLARSIPSRAVVGTLTSAAVILAIAVVPGRMARLEQPEETQREISLAEASALVRAFEDREGIVHADLRDHNLLMYAAPLDTRVVFRPLRILATQYVRGTPLPDSLTLLLRMDRRTPRIPEFRQIAVQRELLDLPSGWRVVELARSRP